MFKDIFNIILESRLQDYKLQLKDQDLARNIFSINDPKKQRMIIKYIKNGSIKYPEDMQIIDKAYEIINRKNLDYNNYNNPQQILDQFNQLNQKLEYNPDNEPCFTNKVELENGVVVYDVKDDIQGLKAVRKAVDYNWGKQSNPWCLVTPPLQTKALEYWNQYNKIPKRICFQNNKLIAFCASSKFDEIQWWDRKNEKPKELKQIVGVQDDPKAIQKIKQFSKKTIENIFEDIKNNRPVIQGYIEDLALNAKLTEQQFNLLYKYDYSLRNILVNNSNCPSELLFRMCRVSNVDYFKASCLKHPNFPKNKLFHYYKSYNKTRRHAIIQNPNCPIQILEDSYKTENIPGKILIAKNPNCSPQLLQKLSKAEDSNIRLAVYKNPNCPKQLIQDLIDRVVQKKDYHAVYDLLHLEICPIQILEQYSENSDSYIRTLVASNPNTPYNILKNLSNDHIYNVCNPARKQIMQRFEVVYPR